MYETFFFFLLAYVLLNDRIFLPQLLASIIVGVLVILAIKKSEEQDLSTVYKMAEHLLVLSLVETFFFVTLIVTASIEGGPGFFLELDFLLLLPK